jgi:hypothetical protein
VLILAENCSATTELASEVADRLATKAGIRPQRCVVLSTHTHSAPLLPEFAPWHYTTAMSAEHLEHMHRYRRDLADRLVQLALDALAARKPGFLSWNEGTASFGTNRRVLENGKWVGFLPSQATESPGPVDHSLPVLRVTDTAGNLVCIVANYACHCTTTSGSYNAIHGDWAGFAHQAIETQHPGVVAMVTIGCGADVGPYPNGTLELAQQHGQQIADAVDSLLKAEWTPVGPELIARREVIHVPLGQLPGRDELQQRANSEQGPLGPRDVARHFLRIWDREGALPQSFEYPITTWTLSHGLTMVFLPGEVTVDYVLRLKREMNDPRLWVTAYANGMPCYISSERLLDEGGYEVDSSMISYGQPARLAPEAEDTIINAVRKLLTNGE